MEENNNFNSKDSFDDIVSDTKGNKDSFEDIISDTSGQKKSFNDDFYYFDTFSDSKHFKKNRRGIKKLLNIGDWWRERKGWQKGLIISFTSIVLVFAILATVIFTVFDYNYNEITKNPEDLGFQQVIDEKIINIALFGIDTRNKKSFKGLSDSIMVLSLNTNTKKVKIVSVMRDTLVPITYNGKKSYNKINSAYNKGPEIAIKTLNTIFGLDISEYATVNFFGMADIIDAVGGIDAELTYNEVYGYRGVNDSLKEICKELGVSSSKHFVKKHGKIHLNGIQAVAYSRIRYQTSIWGTSNDYGRTDRQRYVMEQLFNKAVKMEKTQYVKLVKALIPCSETSLSYNEIMSLATSILLHSPTFEQSRIPLVEYQMGSKSVPGVGSCVYYDLDYAGKLLHAFIYDDITPEDYIEQHGVEKNDWYTGATYRPTTPTKPDGGDSSSSETSSDTLTSSGTESGDESGIDGTESGDESGTESGESSDVDGTESGESSGGESSGDGNESSGSDSSEASSGNPSTPTGGNSSDNSSSGGTSGIPSGGSTVS
ncbi:MAG: LCP family protein [Clostridia bacterium]|nr:LCP family protein [Clostridia bacterium]